MPYSCSDSDRGSLKYKVRKFLKLLRYFGKFTFNSQKRVSHFLEINSQKKMQKMDTPGPEVIRLFMLNSAEHGIYPAHNVKMPIIC